jgi:hypothetical protein
MTVLPHIMLDAAEGFVAVANTPIFLARRLREDSAVKTAHQIHGANAIFAALESISKKKPATLADVAEAYLYLVALSFDNELSWLRRARAISNPYIKWYGSVADYLLTLVTPTITTNMQLSANPPRSLVVNPSQTRGSSSNVFTKITA